ncbi:sugar ABC transporter permease [soil metagenome]
MTSAGGTLQRLRGKFDPPVTTRKTKNSFRNGWIKRLPLLPALVFTIVVTQLPFLSTIWFSLQSWQLLRAPEPNFVGLQNYALVWTEERFRNAALNTVTMTVSAVLVSLILGLLLALLVYRKFLGRGIVRTLLITPFLVMPAAAALLWKSSIFDPVFGLLNFALSPLGFGRIDWLGQFPMFSVVAVLVWQWMPFMMLIILAGLQSQDAEVLEAARMDGAGTLQTFRYMTLPHIRRFMELGAILGSIFILQTFDAILLMTQGGPGNKTTNLPYFLYLTAFRALDVGQAAALGVVVVAATILISTFALRMFSTVFAGSNR